MCEIHKSLSRLILLQSVSGGFLRAQFVHQRPPSRLRWRRFAAVLGGSLLDVTASAEHLEVVERPRIAATVERHDVVHLVPVLPARRAAPVRGVQHGAPDVQPTAGRKVLIVMTTH